MDHDAWQEALQAPQPEPEGLVVPVYRHGALSWHVEFAGPAMPTSRIVQAFLHVGAVVVHDRVLRAREKATEQNHTPPLTPQEAACIHWAGLGKTNAEIGKIMGISPRTARFHIDNVRQKYGAKTRTQAIVAALGRAINASSTGYVQQAAASAARSA
jgi:DNA-binding CsgD family transcriptional regulator